MLTSLIVLAALAAIAYALGGDNATRDIDPAALDECRRRHPATISAGRGWR